MSLGAFSGSSSLHQRQRRPWHDLQAAWSYTSWRRQRQRRHSCGRAMIRFSRCQQRAPSQLCRYLSAWAQGQLVSPHLCQLTLHGCHPAWRARALGTACCPWQAMSSMSTRWRESSWETSQHMWPASSLQPSRQCRRVPHLCAPTAGRPPLLSPPQVLHGRGGQSADIQTWTAGPHALTGAASISRQPCYDT